MADITKDQIKCIKTLVRKLNIEDEDALVRGYSNMRTDHVSEMNGSEGAAMIKHLKSTDPAEVSAQQMRRKILAMAYNRAGLPRDANKKQKERVQDWVNGWCKQYGYKHKAMNSYTLEELPMLVSQFQNVRDSLIINI